MNRVKPRLDHSALHSEQNQVGDEFAWLDSLSPISRRYSLRIIAKSQILLLQFLDNRMIQLFLTKTRSIQSISEIFISRRIFSFRSIFSLDGSLKLLVTSYNQFRVKVHPGISTLNASIKNILSSNVFYKTTDHSLQSFLPCTRTFHKPLFRAH